MMLSVLCLHKIRSLNSMGLFLEGHTVDAILFDVEGSNMTTVLDVDTLGM